MASAPSPKTEDGSAARRAGGTLALLLGGALVQAAGSSPLVWQMAAASRADLGGELGGEWLPRLTSALVAVGVILGGRLADQGRASAALVAGAVGLGGGCGLAALLPDSAPAVLGGIGVLASLASGVLVAAGVCQTMAIARRPARGFLLGLTLGAGLLAANRVFSMASFLSLARGVPWLLGQMAWVGPAAGALGALLLVLAGRAGTLGRRDDEGEGRLPLLGPKAVGEGFPSTDSAPFWTLFGLALLASFGGLAVQRGVAALAMVGLPESSFGSGVMAGMALALLRPLGPAVGGLVHDLLGPRGAVGLTALALAVGLVLLTRYEGPDGPWNEIAGFMGVATGMAVLSVPAAGSHLLGRKHLGAHYGMLYLGFAVGEVLMAPLAPVVASSPVAVLLAIAAGCVVVAFSATRLAPPKRREAEAREAGRRKGRK